MDYVLHYFPFLATMNLFKMFWVGVDLNYEVCSNQISCYPEKYLLLSRIMKFKIETHKYISLPQKLLHSQQSFNHNSLARLDFSNCSTPETILFRKSRLQFVLEWLKIHIL